MISVMIDEQSYKDMQNTLRRLRKDLPRAAVSSMSKSLTKVKQILVDETVSVINLKKGRVTDDITTYIDGDIESGNLDNFRMLIKSVGSPIGLVNFARNARTWNWKNPTPIKVKIYKNGTTHTFSHAFIANGRGAGGVMHMWQRESKFGQPYKKSLAYWKMPHDYRFPLLRMTTIRIQDIQDKPAFSVKVLKEGGAIIIKDLNGAIVNIFRDESI
jgi:hypothetical protein